MKTNQAQQVEIEYWIQEQAPAGNYYDSRGMHQGCSLGEAVAELASHKQYWPDSVCRLVQKLIVPIA
jgi:hypothetical protein